MSGDGDGVAVLPRKGMGQPQPLGPAARRAAAVFLSGWWLTLFSHSFQAPWFFCTTASSAISVHLGFPPVVRRCADSLWGGERSEL